MSSHMGGHANRLASCREHRSGTRILPIPHRVLLALGVENTFHLSVHNVCLLLIQGGGQCWFSTHRDGRVLYMHVHACTCM